jgi:hypothetical protein
MAPALLRGRNHARGRRCGRAPVLRVPVPRRGGRQGVLQAFYRAPCYCSSAMRPAPCAASL